MVAGRPDDIEHVIATLRLVELLESQGPKLLDAKSVAKALSIRSSAVAEPTLKSLRAAIKSRTLEGRYRSCSTAYMQILGGVRNDKDIRRCLNERTPQCRKFESASLMRLAFQKLLSEPAVQASTIHRAKGREWQHVFVIGATDGVMPDYRSHSPDRLIEERNLMFVAATRASSSLTLLHAPHTLQPRGSSVLNALRASRFLHTSAVQASLSLVLSSSNEMPTFHVGTAETGPTEGHATAKARRVCGATA